MRYLPGSSSPKTEIRPRENRIEKRRVKNEKKNEIGRLRIMLVLVESGEGYYGRDTRITVGFVWQGWAGISRVRTGTNFRCRHCESRPIQVKIGLL